MVQQNCKFVHKTKLTHGYVPKEELYKKKFLYKPQGELVKPGVTGGFLICKKTLNLNYL